MEDRIVHATDGSLCELVRYDRAGRWYVEYAPHTNWPRKNVTLREAAIVALDWAEDGGEIIARQPGGQRFASAVERLRRDLHGGAA